MPKTTTPATEKLEAMGFCRMRRVNPRDELWIDLCRDGGPVCVAHTDAEQTWAVDDDEGDLLVSPAGVQNAPEWASSAVLANMYAPKVVIEIDRLPVV